MTLSNGRTSAYQWDYGLKVNTTDAVGTVVRFANEHGSRAIPVEAVEEGLNKVYHIPDILLTTGRAIVMYHLGGDGDTSVYTTTEDFLPVYEAPKPDDYIFTEEEIRTWQELDERLTEAEGDIVALESGKADVVHTHTESDITDLGSYVPTSRTVNGKSLSSDISLSYTDVGAAAESHTHTESDITDLGSYVPTSRTVNGKALSSDISLTNTDVGAAASSHTHTESQITDLGDYISDPSTKTADQVLTWDGTAWVAEDLPDQVDIFYISLSDGIPTCNGMDIHNALVDGKQVIIKPSMWEYSFPSFLSDAMTYEPPNVIIEYYTTGLYSTDATITKITLAWSNNSWRRITESVTLTEGGGGGGGTDDYSDLTNKPQINSVTLSGNKSSSDLGLADAVHTHSQYLTQETDPTVPAWAKASEKPTYTASEVGALPDDTAIPTKVSDLTNDSGFLTTETDPTVPSWAKASTKPTYTAAEVGALPDDTEIPTKVSDLTNDSGFITTETDPTVPSWAKQSTKPSYTAAEVGAVPTTRTVNGKALSSDINLSIGDLKDVIEVQIGTDWGNDGTSLADIETAYLTGNMVIGYLDEDESTTAYPLRVFYSDGVHASSTNSYALFEGVGDDGKILRFYRRYSSWNYKHITPLPEPWAAAENEFVYFDGSGWGTQYQTAVRIIYDFDGVSYITECLDHQQVPMVYRSTDRMIGTLCGVHYDDTDPYHLVPDKYFFRAVGESGVVETWSVEGSGDPWDVTWTTVETPLIPAPSSPSAGDVLTYSNGSWVAQTPSGGGTPEVFILHEDPITGYPTESPADIVAAFNAENLLVYYNGTNYYYVNYFSNDPSSVMYMIIPSAAYQNISTMELTYDYTQQSWSRSFSSWDLVPTARKVNNKALSSDITLTSSDVGAIANPSTKTAGQFLSWNGSAWVAASLPIWNGSVT